MRVLTIGCKGEDVVAWQQFLRGQKLYMGVVDGDFGPITTKATCAFQNEHGIIASGEVNDPTLAAAMSLGFGVVQDGRPHRSGPNWPVPPTGLRPLTVAEKDGLFGRFPYTPKPTASNPEAIVVSPKWVREHIETVKVPFAGGKLRPVAFHKLAADKLRALFSAWEVDGLLDRLITWDGGYAPRFVRGSRVTLSSHAWGTAFDVNARWNAFGAVPALLGTKGCVRELVERANELGFWWGGHFKDRQDGMHLELVRL